VDRFGVISGCSSGGKSTLIAELAKRRYAVVDEPGRRIVKEELARGGSALPWVDRVAFARRAIAIALTDRAVAGSLDGWVFFDRGLIDAAAALEHMTGKPVLTALGQAKERLNKGLEHGRRGYGDLLTGHCTGQLGLAGAVLGIGTV